MAHTRAQSMTALPAAPRQHRRTSSTITSDIFTTCRALQSRLSTNLSQSPLRALRTPTLLPSPAFTAGATYTGVSAKKRTVEHTAPERAQTPPRALNAPTLLPSPIFTAGATTTTVSAKKKTAEQSARKRLQTPPRGARAKITESAPKTPPRGANKRRRSISDDSSRVSITEPSHNNGPSTPKRQRIAPPSLPLGLSLDDFDNLDYIPPPSSASLPCNAPVAMPCRKKAQRPTLGIQTLSPMTYSSSLVSLIREKLSLGGEGVGVQSGAEGIDQRWRVLLAQAEAERGLKVRREMVIRRGGRRERVGLGALEGVW